MTFYKLLDQWLEDFKEQEQQEKLKEYILDPAADYVINRFKPYAMGASLLISIMILLILVILMLLIKKS